MKKKILSLLLVCTMAISMLAGCGEKEPAASEQPAATEEVAEEVAEVEEEKEVVELRLIMFGVMDERQEDFFTGEFHDKMLEELKIDFSVEFLPWGSQAEITTMLAGGDSFAFMNIPTAFPAFVTEGYILDIDPAMVEEVAPAYIESRFGMDFESVRMNGKYWALPIGSKVMAGDGSNLTVRNDLLKEVGTSYDQIKTMDDFMNAAAAVKEKHPEMVIWAAPHVTAKAFPEVVSPAGTYYMHANGGTEFVTVDQYSGEAIPTYGSEYFENIAKLNEQFYELGYTTKDVLTDSAWPLAQWDAGNALSYIGYSIKVMEHELPNVAGSEQQYLQIGDAPYFKTKNYDWAVSFAKGEADKLDRWMELFNWFYESEENFNFAVYGVEGEDWEYGENNAIVQKSASNMFYQWFLTSLTTAEWPQYDQTEVEKYKNFEKGEVIMDQTLGFVFNKTPEGGEDFTAIDAALVTIRDEKIKPLLFGFGDYDTDFPVIYEELKAAGYEEYCAEYIRQYNEWKAAK